MEVSTSLLSTKLYFPPARPNLVPRPRLVEQLNAGLTKPLTLISAPAGFGKTSLMSEWRMGNESGISAAWLSLDDGDNNPLRFWLYLIAALETLQDNSFDTIHGLLQSPEPIAPETIASSILHELESFREDHVIVLDDLHIITSPGIQQALAFLLDHLPPKSHLVILTRADPPLPLSRLRVRNQLTELRAADLRFTLDEVTTFLTLTMGLHLTQEQIASLEARTEGWIAGLQLAALSMQGRGDVDDFVAAFTGSHHYVVDYLIEEVLSLQSEKMRSFLLKTCILERMNASLCNTLTGESDGQPMLEELERANLFVVGLDNERQWYRYHRLFADVLRGRLKLSDAKGFVDLHHRAAEWHEKNALLTEALDHTLAAGDLEYAAHLVEKNALSMLFHGELIMLLNWLDKVKNEIPRRPWLSIYQAWVLVHTGQQEKAASILDQVEQKAFSSATGAEGREVRGHVAAIRAHIAAYRWDGAGALAFGHQAMELLPATNLAIRSFVAQVVGGVYLLSGDLESASSTLSKARQLGKAAGNLHVAVLATFMLANLRADQGQLHRAVETYREALQLAITRGGQPLPVAARAYNGLGGVYYEWNDLDTASQFASQCIALAKKWGNINALVSAHLIMARVKRARGDLNGAQSCIYEAEDLAHNHTLAPGGTGSLEINQVSLWLAAGNLEAATRWTLRKGFRVDDQVPPLREAEYRMFARVLLAQNETEAALTLMSRLLAVAESAGKAGDLIELLILKALALQARKDIAPALGALKQALILAQPEGYVRVFIDKGKPLQELLKRVKGEEQAKNYVHNLLAFFGGETSPGSQPLIEPLSERELEIMRLVAGGKSNQEIAAELYLAVGTVKKHISNIFGKLNVDSRTRCIAQARELHLIE